MEEAPTADGGEHPQGARSVASGILWSRLAGLLRESLLRSVLGLGPAADAFGAALRIPNVLQNLLGEGSLSASFIPVYSRLLGEGRDEEAGRVAGAVAGLMAVLSGGLALFGIVFARPLTSLLAPGFDGPRHELTIDLIRVTTAGVGFLVLSAWCLGVLNSHRRFFLPYVAPVLWNGAQILVLLAALFADWEAEGAARALAWGLVAGGLLQFGIQALAVRTLLPELRPGLDRKDPGVVEVRRRFVPAVLGRGVVQLSGYVDLVLASLLATGAVAALLSAQALYLLPLSLFALSVAAAELPEMSRAGDTAALAGRTSAALRRTAFFTVFSGVAYVAVGEPIVDALFGWGAFDADDARVVWLVLAAYSLGLPATSVSRVLQGTCHSVGDTAGPARIAGIRVVVAAVVGVALMFQFDEVWVLDGDFGTGTLGIGTAAAAPHLGAAGLALGSAVAAWVELGLLSGRARRAAADLPSPAGALGSLAVPASLAFLTGAAAKLLLGGLHPLLAAPLALGVAGLVYLAAAFRTGVPEAHLMLGPIRRRLWD
ncbi:MAG: murein biosynthesis integral membrane protein MurJ [Acidimicrobiaceae bacterium]|nr:murein biosynthesis integral membrane protein MurJ [Acidimicrobiaceae bacterium]|tara:strand:- start:5890 stop:7518 length:1629 start_codon:yes stop_codon:yes gene_type:complete